MTPQHLAQRARAELRKAADPRIAAGQRAYFKKWEKVHFRAAMPARQRARLRSFQ